MSEQFHQQIDKAQADVEAKAQGAAAKDIQKYHATYRTAVDKAQADLKGLKLESVRAQTYLNTALPEVAGLLGEMAERGQQIVKARAEKKKDGAEADVPSLEKLSNSLSTKLAGLKAEAESFRKLEVVAKELKEIHEANKKLDESGGEVSPGQMLAKKTELREKLRKIGPGLTGATGESKYYADDLFTNQYKYLFDDISEDQVTLTAAAVHAKQVSDFAFKARQYGDLHKTYEQNPTPENLAWLRKAEAVFKINGPKVEKSLEDAFSTDPDLKGSPESYKGRLFKRLNDDYRAAKELVEGLQKAVAERQESQRLIQEQEAKRLEEEQLSKEVAEMTTALEAMMPDLEAKEEATLEPLWDDFLSFRKNPILTDEQAGTEDGLLSGYLALKMTIEPYVNLKVPAPLQAQIQKKMADIEAKIGKIAQARLTRKMTTSLEEHEITQYVTLLSEPQDGKYYVFNAAFDELTDQYRQKVRMSAEYLYGHNTAQVAAEIQKAVKNLNEPKTDKVVEMLGKQAGKYAEGLQLLSEGKRQEAIDAFLAYTKQSFDPEEQEIHAEALKDAQNKLLFLSLEATGSFYSGLEKYASGDMNGAAADLKNYIETAEGLAAEDANAGTLHAEQIKQARVVFKLIGIDRVKQLEGLLADMKVWKKADLQDRWEGRGEKPDFKIEGEEVWRIGAGIAELQDKVAKGELVDFNAEFAALQGKVTEYLQKTAHSEENAKDNVIDRMAKLYEGLNSPDAKVRSDAALAFAQELRDLKSYDLAREYLDKALQPEYAEAEKALSRDEVMQKMQGDGEIMQNIRMEAASYLQQFEKEYPDASPDELRQRAEQVVFSKRLDKECKRQWRHMLTKSGMAMEPLLDTEVLVGAGLIVAGGAEVVLAGLGKRALERGEKNQALELYNSMSPYAKKTSFRPDTFSAEDYDAWKETMKEEVAMALVMAPMTMGVGAVGAKVGGFLAKGIARRLAPKLLMRLGGSAGAEGAFAAVESGNLMALRAGDAAFDVLAPAVQKMILRSQLIARVGGIGAGILTEGVGMYGMGIGQELAMNGQLSSSSYSAERLVESILMAGVFRGIGAGGDKIFKRALEQGGLTKGAAIVGTEFVSGLGGTAVEMANFYRKNHGKLEGFDPFTSLLVNAVTSAAMHGGRKLATPGGGGRGGGRGGRDGRKLQAAYTHETYGKPLGVDFSKPESIKTARVTPDGVLIINGKTLPGGALHVGMVDALPQNAQDRIRALAPDNAIDSHFHSRFSTEVPAELLPNGDASRSREVQGWIDTDGKIHYNLDYLNNGSVGGDRGGGLYRGEAPKKVMPEGYRGAVNEKGIFVLVGPDGKEMNMRDFLKTDAGKKSPLMAEMKRIKLHEETHRALEKALTKEGGDGKRVEDAAKTAGLKDMFAKPDANGNVPPGKIPLVDHNGNPMELTFQNIQEYLCHVADGSIPIDASMKSRFEAAVGAEVPGFTLAKARQVSTRMLAQNSAEKFRRNEAARVSISPESNHFEADVSPMKPAEAKVADFQRERMSDLGFRAMVNEILGQARKPTPTELGEIKNKIKNGEITDNDLVQLLFAEAIPLEPDVVNLLIANATLEPVREILFKNKSPLTPDQQINLFHMLRGKRSIGWLLKFLNNEKINPGIPDIRDILMQSEDGLNLLIDFAQRGTFTPDGPFIEKLLANGRAGIDIIQDLIAQNYVPHDVLILSSEKIGEKMQIYEDADFIGGVKAKDDLAKVFDDFEQGKVDADNPLAAALDRFKGRDPEGYKFLRSNLSELNVDFIQAIVDGNKLEKIDTVTGQSIVGYVGKSVGEGGMGKVFAVAYAAKGSDKLQFNGVYKIPHGHAKAEFRNEIGGAKLIQRWDNPHINKPLFIGDNFIIYETGPNAKSFDASIMGLSPQEGLRLFRQSLEGVNEYQKQGYIHGDLKGANILIVDTPQGKKALLIDNTPLNAANFNKGWPHTEQYAIFYNDENFSYVAKNPGARFHGADNYSMIMILKHDYLQYLGKSLAPEQYQKIQNIIDTYSKPEHLSRPEAISELMAEIDAIIPTLPDSVPKPKPKISLRKPQAP